MVKNSNIPNAKSAKSTDISKQDLPLAQIKPDEVSWVLEHVSSQFRWEVLEVAHAPPTSSSTDLQTHRSSD